MRVDEGWDGFWAQAPTAAESVFWDAPPEEVVARHLALCEPYLTADLPLVGAGCGNGTQTRHLGERHGVVVGVDLSPAAVELARRRPGGAEFEVLDLADGAAVAAFHERRGDCHVHLRGVLHQAPPEERARIVAGVAALLGAAGRGFVVEPASAARETLAVVFAHGISPMEMPDEAVPALFAERGLAVLAAGRAPMATTVRGPEGARVELPSSWLVVGRTG